jgi:hypothetical protein
MKLVSLQEIESKSLCCAATSLLTELFQFQHVKVKSKSIPVAGCGGL